MVGLLAVFHGQSLLFSFSKVQALQVFILCCCNCLGYRCLPVKVSAGMCSVSLGSYVDVRLIDIPTNISCLHTLCVWRLMSFLATNFSPAAAASTLVFVMKACMHVCSTALCENDDNGSNELILLHFSL